MTDHDPTFASAFMDDYFAESEEHLTVVRQRLLILEAAIGSGEPQPEVLEELFRSFHSLKGISAMVELREAERLAHEMESCLASIRDRRITPDSSTVDALIQGTSALEAVIASRRAGSAIPVVESHVARLSAASAGA